MAYGKELDGAIGPRRAFATSNLHVATHGVMDFAVQVCGDVLATTE